MHPCSLPPWALSGYVHAAQKPFDAQMYAMMGSPYAMAERDVLVYGRPYKEDPAASAAISKTMDQVRPWGVRVRKGKRRERTQAGNPGAEMSVPSDCNVCIAGR